MPGRFRTSYSSFSRNEDAFHPTPVSSLEDETAHGGHSSMEDQRIHLVAPFTQAASHEKAIGEPSAGLAAPSGDPDLHSTYPTKERAQSESSESSRKRRRYEGPTGPKAPIPRRRSSVPIRRKGQDLISFHRQSCRLFQSLEGTLATSQGWTGETNRPYPMQGSMPNDFPMSQSVVKTENGFAYLIYTPSSPRYGSRRNSRRNSSATTPNPVQYAYCDGPSVFTTTSSSLSSLACTSTSILDEKIRTPSEVPPRRPHPVPVLSWTSAESRRLEYEKIDRSYSGFRGLWKRVMPRWCHGRHSRRAFFDGKSSDAGSVRRYRMALDDDDAEDDDRSIAADDENPASKSTPKKARIWSCLSLLQ